MPKFESTPNLNNPELNPSEISTSNAEVPLMITKDMEQQLSGKGLSGEEINKLRPEDAWEILNGKKEGQQVEGKEVEELELSPEDQLKNLESEATAKQEEMTRLSESIEGTKSALNAAREKLGLPPDEEDPPSTFTEKDKMEKLKAEQEILEKQKEELISQQEKERLIREEKEKILQEKLDEVFKEFEKLNPRDFESIFKSGKTSEGGKVESKSMGSLDPEIAQSLAKAFKEGIKLLPKILEALPELLKKFDEDLTKEATERVDKKLEEEKQKLEEEQKKEEKPEEPKIEEKPKIPEGEIPPGEIKPEVNPIEGGNTETPKV